MAMDFELENHEVHVSYVDSNIAGKPQLTISGKGVTGTVQTFTDHQITRTESVFGDAVTVTLKLQIDNGSKLFTLFLPKLAGAFRARPVSTAALLTVNTGVVSAPNLTSRRYEAMMLSGTVSVIDT